MYIYVGRRIGYVLKKKKKRKTICAPIFVEGKLVHNLSKRKNYFTVYTALTQISAS